MTIRRLSRVQQKADVQSALGWMLLLNLARAYNFTLPDDIGAQLRLGSELYGFLEPYLALAHRLAQNPDQKLQFQNRLGQFLRLHCSCS